MGLENGRFVTPNSASLACGSIIDLKGMASLQHMKVITTKAISYTGRSTGPEWKCSKKEEAISATMLMVSSMVMGN